MSAGESSASNRDPLKPLRWGLIAGASYDVAFAAVMILAPHPVAERLGVPLPGEAFYLRVLAVLLCMIAAMYLVAASSPQREPRLIRIAILGRLGGFLAFASAAFGRPALAGLWIVGAIDLAFAIQHAATSRALRS